MNPEDYVTEKPDVDEEHADEVLERARTLAVQKSLTVDDVFDVLERLGPTLQAL